VEAILDHFVASEEVFLGRGKGGDHRENR